MNESNRRDKKYWSFVSNKNKKLMIVSRREFPTKRDVNRTLVLK